MNNLDNLTLEQLKQFEKEVENKQLNEYYKEFYKHEIVAKLTNKCHKCNRTLGFWANYFGCCWCGGD